MTLDKKTISSAQCRGARAMLGWSRAELAKAAKVAQATLADFETDKRTPYHRTLADIRAALEAGGATFCEDGEKVGVMTPRSG